MLKVNVTKTRKDFKLDVNFTLEDEELFAILGPSGCGKSTLLNLISGVVTPDSGEIIFGEKIFYSENKKINYPIHKRKIGYIQQKANLFPHLTVKQNIAYGFKEKNEKKIEEMMEFLGISFLKDKRPAKISGGQAQRVSLARALMTNPKLLLLDEPFSALDNLRRLRLREVLLEIKKEFQIPMIFVTHDLDEAYALGNKIAVMDNGSFLQVGDKDEVFRNPVNTKVANFVGMKNIFSGRVVKITKAGLDVEVAGEILKTPPFHCELGQKIILGIRPEDIIFVKSDRAINKPIKYNTFSAVVTKKSKGTENSKFTIKIVKNKLTLEMILPNHIVQKYKIEKGTLFKVSLKKNSLTLLKS